MSTAQDASAASGAAGVHASCEVSVDISLQIGCSTLNSEQPGETMVEDKVPNQSFELIDAVQMWLIEISAQLVRGECEVRPVEG